jgi:hypothetical protein
MLHAETGPTTDACLMHVITDRTATFTRSKNAWPRSATSTSPRRCWRKTVRRVCQRAQHCLLDKPSLARGDPYRGNPRRSGGRSRLSSSVFAREDEPFRDQVFRERHHHNIANLEDRAVLEERRVAHASDHSHTRLSHHLRGCKLKGLPQTVVVEEDLHDPAGAIELPHRLHRCLPDGLRPVKARVSRYYRACGGSRSTFRLARKFTA